MKPALRKRPLLTMAQVGDLDSLFKLLANGTRLRLVHALARSKELCLTDLAGAVGMKPQAVSNQLRRLVDRKVLACSRGGNRSFYRIVDPCLPEILDKALCLLEDAQAQ